MRAGIPQGTTSQRNGNSLSVRNLFCLFPPCTIKSGIPTGLFTISAGEKPASCDSCTYWPGFFEENSLKHAHNTFSYKALTTMTPASVTAFCPGHISGYFRRVDGRDLATTGSIGAGIVINEGVTVTVSAASSPSVTIRRQDGTGAPSVLTHDSPPLFSAMGRLGVSAAVVTECRLPIGAGFGLSAAALLASLTALDRLYGCGMDAHGIATIAHETEVLHRTGLGDVAACQSGGRVVRTGAGIDGHIERWFDLTESLYAISFGPIHTPSVLGSPAQMDRVTRAFPRDSPDSIADFFRLSREFADKSGLLTSEVRQVFGECDSADVPAGMTMLGNGVFAYGARAGPVLRAFGEVYELHMAESGVRIVEEVP